MSPPTTDLYFLLQTIRAYRYKNMEFLEPDLKGDPVSAKRKPSKKATGKSRKGSETKEALSMRLIKAMAHPLRVKILALLNDGELSPNELSEILNVGLSQVSYHVKVLKDFEMAEMTRTEPRRGAVEHYYRALERAYIPSRMTKSIPKSGQRDIANDILEAIETDVAASVESGTFYERDDSHVSYTPVDVDTQGCKEANELADEFVDRLLEIKGRSDDRVAKAEGEVERVALSAGLLLYPAERCVTSKRNKKGKAKGKTSPQKRAAKKGRTKGGKSS